MIFFSQIFTFLSSQKCFSKVFQGFCSCTLRIFFRDSCNVSKTSVFFEKLIKTKIKKISQTGPSVNTHVFNIEVLI